MGEPYKVDTLNFLHTLFDANYEPRFPAVMRVVSDYAVVGSETRTHGTNENNGSPFGAAVLIEIVLTQPRR